MTSSWFEDEGFLAAARRDLLAPPAALEVTDLARLWRWDEARVVCERPRHLEDTPDLALRMRGALGRVLRELAGAARRPEPWGRATAYELLYEWDLPHRGGLEVARPFVVRADVRGDEVEVAVRLFGWAGLYVDEVLHALATALDDGVALRAGGRMRVPFRPRQAQVDRTEGVEIGGPAANARLLFDSPTVIRRGGRLTLDPPSILMAAVGRVASLAPWMEVSLAHDARALRAAAEALSCRLHGLQPRQWRRNSIRRRDAPIPVYAFEGAMDCTGRLEPLVPYLRLAETCGLGSHAALGFGRVRVVLF